jgi:hypothetical protein
MAVKELKVWLKNESKYGVFRIKICVFYVNYQHKMFLCF